MPDDSMGPVTDDLVARLAADAAALEITGRGGLVKDIRAAIDRLTHLERELAEARRWRDNYERLCLNDIERASSIDDELVASQAEVERLRGLVETAFRDGLSYGTDVVVKDPDEAWRTSRVRAAITRQGETG